MNNIYLGTFRAESNFRDLGKYVTADGHQIKPGVFYRSCTPAIMTSEEQLALSQLGLKMIIDLRTDYEAYEIPDPEIGNAEYYRISGMREATGDGVDFSPEGIRRMQRNPDVVKADISRHMREIYLAMVFHNQAFEFLLIAIKEGGHLPTLFHCATGKDRTGALSMLILLMLGCNRETCMRDYLYSNVSFQKELKEAFEAHKDEIQNHPERAYDIQIMKGVSEELGSAMLDGILEKYPDYDTFFFEEYGLSKSELSDIRAKYLL